MRSKYFSATIYAKQGHKTCEDGLVGISFMPAPSMTRSELYEMIDDLMALAKNMRQDNTDAKPHHEIVI